MLTGALEADLDKIQKLMIKRRTKPRNCGQFNLMIVLNSE